MSAELATEAEEWVLIPTFDCDEAEELPAGWRTSPKSAAPGLVTPVQII